MGITCISIISITMCIYGRIMKIFASLKYLSEVQFITLIDSQLTDSGTYSTYDATYDSTAKIFFVVC